jgi:hypothetical protein
MSTAATTKPLGLAHVKTRLAKLPQAMMSETIVIDKDVAQALLARNTHNRVLNRQAVEQNKLTIARGRWEENGDPIRISKTGVLLDGAHKLTTISEADAMFSYIVVWGLNDTAQATMDVGHRRGLAQHLYLQGERNATALAATLKFIWQIYNNGSTSWKFEVTYPEYSEYLEANPDIRDSVLIGLKVARTLKVPASSIGTAHYVCSKAGTQPDKADDFFTELGDLNSGTVLAPDSPILAMRHASQAWLSRGSVSRMDQAVLYDGCVRAFDAYVAHVSMSTRVRLAKKVRTYRLPS